MNLPVVKLPFDLVRKVTERIPLSTGLGVERDLQSVSHSVSYMPRVSGTCDIVVDDTGRLVNHLLLEINASQKGGLHGV